MKNVLVINKSFHDYSKAEEFGKLIFMSEGSMNRFAVSSIFRAFEPFINRSKPDDYLLLGGASIMGSIACSLFAVKHRCLNLLIYKPIPKKPGVYLERIIVF